MIKIQVETTQGTFHEYECGSVTITPRNVFTAQTKNPDDPDAHTKDILWWDHYNERYALNIPGLENHTVAWINITEE